MDKLCYVYKICLIILLKANKKCEKEVLLYYSIF